MKKTCTLILAILIVALAVFTLQVNAAPAPGPDKTKPAKEHTPGAQATQNAVQNNTNPPGNSDKKTTNSPGNSDKKATGAPGNSGNKSSHEAKGKKQNFKGEVSAVSAESLTLTLSDGSTQTFAVTAETRVHIPTTGADASVDQIPSGARAAVQAYFSEDGVLTARRVMIIPGKPAASHHVGVVSEYTPGASITILDKDGQPFTCQLSEQTRILPGGRSEMLVPGARVTLIFGRSVDGSPITARAVVVHPEIQAEATPATE